MTFISFSFDLIIDKKIVLGLAERPGLSQGCFKNLLKMRSIQVVCEQFLIDF